MNPCNAYVTAYHIMISCNCLFTDSTWKLLHISFLSWPKSEIPSRKQFLMKDNTTTKMYKRKYRAFKTKIPNNKLKQIE